MSWILNSFLSAFFTSAKSALSKKSLESLDEYTVSWFIRFLSFVFILPMFLFLPIPELGRDFWWVMLLNGILGAVATVLYSRAMMKSDLSVIAPIATFDSVILIITSYIILGEMPSINGLIGVLLIAAGTYFLNLSQKKNGRMAPIKVLFEDEGARLMMIAVIIWSLTSSYDKIGIRNSSPVFWSLAMNASMMVILLPVSYRKMIEKRREVRRQSKNLILIGIAAVLMIVTNMVAISQSLVVYVISVKKTSILMSIIFGRLMFNERNISERLLGGVIMIVGVLLITI